MAKIVKPEQTREYYVAPNIDLGLEPVFEQARKNKEEEKQKAKALAEERQKQLDANMEMLDSARGYVSEDGIWAGVTNNYADSVYNKARELASEGDYEGAANFVEQNMTKVKRYDANQKQVSEAVTNMATKLNNNYFAGGEGFVARYLTDRIGKHMTNPTMSGDVLANINKYASEQDLLSYAAKQGELDENAVVTDFLNTFNQEKYTNSQGGYLQKKGFTDSSGNVKSVGELISEGYVDVAKSSPAMKAVLDQHITEMAGSDIDEGAETGREAYAKALQEVLSPKLTTNVKANPVNGSGSGKGVGLGKPYKIEPDKLAAITDVTLSKGRIIPSRRYKVEQVTKVHEMVEENFGGKNKLQTEFFLKNLPKDIDKSSFEDGAEIIPLKKGKALNNVIVKGEEVDVRNFVNIGGEIYATVSVDVEEKDFEGYNFYFDGNEETEEDKELKKKTKEANKLVKLSNEEFETLTEKDPKEYVGETKTEADTDSDMLPPSAK